MFLSIISGLEEEVSSKVDNFAHLWPKKWDPFFPSSTSQSKLDPLRNLASASPPGYTFTNGSVSPLQTVSLATKPPFHDQSTVSLLKFDFLRRPARLGRWRKQHPKTNISDTRVGLYKRELRWGGLSVDGVLAGVTAALPRRRAKTVGSWRSYPCSREQMRVMLRLDKLPYTFWEAADREVEIAAGSLAKWAHLGIFSSCSSLGWSGSVGYSADASREHRLSSPCAQREVSADPQIGFSRIVIIPGVIIIT